MNTAAEPLHILVASANATALAQTLTSCGNGVLSAADGLSALKLLAARQAQTVICDLPLEESLELCRAIRADATLANLWFVLIATRLDEAALAQAQAAGVSDLLTWPVKSLDLLCRLHAAANAVALVRELERRTHAAAQLNADLAATNARLEHIAITDDLTGLFNRRHAITKLNEYWAIAERYHQPLACAIFDLDHFKSVNDTYGHFVGDVVLRRLASVVLETVRSTDLVCRIGGEEFLIIFPAQSAAQIAPGVERCRNTIAAQRITCGDDELSVTISAGIAEKTPATCTPDEVLKLADAALYEAKRFGRNCTVIDGQNPSIQPLGVAS